VSAEVKLARDVAMFRVKVVPEYDDTLPRNTFLTPPATVVSSKTPIPLWIAVMPDGI
jgi:hypothetical protein